MKQRIYGIDFTSAPGRRKPIVLAECLLDGAHISLTAIVTLPDFPSFETFLRRPGPWVCGFDFPFGQSRRFIEGIGWPQTWAGYAAHVATLDRDAFCLALETYKSGRQAGDREHRRRVDVVAGAISPQKLYGVPVGKMFHEGVRRLIMSGVHIPLLLDGDRTRIALETYPGSLARFLIGRQPYKTDTRTKQRPSHLDTQRAMIAALQSDRFRTAYGLEVCPPSALSVEPSADHLDAFLCAIQAGAAALKRDANFGIPVDADPLEGWICDPTLAMAPV